MLCALCSRVHRGLAWLRGGASVCVLGVSMLQWCCSYHDAGATTSRWRRQGIRDERTQRGNISGLCCLTVS